MGAILRLVRDAHARMCPAVPLVGWDVALTTEGRCASSRVLGLGLGIGLGLTTEGRCASSRPKP